MRIASSAKAMTAADGTTVLDVAGRPLVQLNSIAAAMWTKLTEGLSIEEMTGPIALQFNLPEERVARVLCGFVEMLKDHDLVKDSPRIMDYHAEMVWIKGIAARCDWRIPDEFPSGQGYGSIAEPRGLRGLKLASNLIPDPEAYRGIKAGDLVWVRLSWLRSFIEQVLPLVRAKFILVTGDSDLSTPLSIMAEAMTVLETPTVLHWYAQNCDGPGFMGRMSPIPIGLDFHTMSERPFWGEEISSPIQQEFTLRSIRQELRPNRARVRKVYADFAWQPSYLYRLERRQEILKQILINDSVILQSRSLTRSQLWRTWGEYAFVLSPHGVGLDCHRTWEALACGHIVLVPSSPLDRLYEGLPVVPIRDWTQITPRNLEFWMDRYSECDISDANLTSKYWVDKMREMASNQLGSGQISRKGISASP